MSSLPVEEQFAGLLDGSFQDPPAFYRQARAEKPMFWSEFTNTWVASRYEDVKRVLSDEECFAPLLGGAGSSAIYGRTILHMDGTEHRRKSAILGKAMRNPRLLDGPQREFVVDLSNELLDKLPPGQPVDLKAGFTTPMPMRVIAWLMGIEAAADFRETYDNIVAAGVSNLTGDPDVHQRGVDAVAVIAKMVEPIIAERRANPSDDLFSTLVTAEVEGERMADDEIKALCAFLFSAGVETTDRALSSLLKKLVVDGSWEKLRDNPELIPSACVEILRWAPPVHGLSRGARVDTELCGEVVQQGQRVFVLLGSANRDEDVFEDSETYLMDRWVGNEDAQFTTKGKVLPFGAGRHYCTGSQLARLEMFEGMRLLMERFSGAEFSHGVPPDTGYMLRSPEHVKVVLAA